MVWFGAAILLGAFLLFQVQPLIGKYILPWFGGTPAVWSACMLFFQGLLLAGYLYSHWSVTRLHRATQVKVHMVLLLAALGILVAQWLSWGTPGLPGDVLKPEGSDFPVFFVIAALALSVGGPYLVLSATGPLVQAWYAARYPGRSPYKLFVLSNAGSLAGLVSYPTVVEPTLSLHAQGAVWAALFVLFAAGMALCGRVVGARESVSMQPPPTCASSALSTEGGKRSILQRFLWVALPFVGSTMLLAATNQICQEIAVIPFLWVLPLTFYLLSFIVTFSGKRSYSRPVWGVALLVGTVGSLVCMFWALEVNLYLQIATHVFAMFAVCMICHGELVRLKPAAERLTEFYLMLSLGGALGGVFVSLVAPALFDGYWEFHLAVWSGWALLLLILFLEKPSWKVQPGFFALRKVIAGGLVALAFFQVWQILEEQDNVLFATRNFYGVLKVSRMGWDDEENRAYKLYHGQIVHGFQYLARHRRREPTSYFSRESGVGISLEALRGLVESRTGRSFLRVGLVGLGVGTLAAYGRKGDVFRFYEINPDVTSLARGSGGFFSFLSETEASVEVVHGDARLSMERELSEGKAQRFDILVLDAFNSDSIPMHLLTREAFATWFAHLSKEGVLLVHTSNRHVDLKPVVQSLARVEGLYAATIRYRGDAERRWSSEWMIVTAMPEFLKLPPVAKKLYKGKVRDDLPPWTDDFSNLFEVLK